VSGLSGTVICTTHISVVHVLGRPVRCLSSTSVLLLYRTVHQCNIFRDITRSAFTSTNRRGRWDKIHQQIRSTLHTSTFGNASVRPDGFELCDPVSCAGCVTIQKIYRRAYDGEIRDPIMLFHVRHTITLFFGILFDINKFYQHTEYVKKLQLLLQRDQQMHILHSNYDNV
jgi:hypothetical protein